MTLVSRMEALLPVMLADIEALVTCESPSADLSAVASSADLVARIGTERLGVSPERTIIDGRTPVTPTVMAAGTTANTVPAAGQVAVDVRVRDAAEQDRVDDAMHALRPVLDGARLEVTGGTNRPPLELGAVGGGAHADDEHVLVAELPRRAALVAALIADLTPSRESVTADHVGAPAARQP